MDPDYEEPEISETNYFSYVLNFGFLCVSVIIYYKLFLSKSSPSLFGRPCSTPRWRIFIKRIYALIIIYRDRYLNRIKCDETFKGIIPDEKDEELEKPSKNITGINSDVLRVLAFDQKGNSISFSIVYYSHWYEATFLLRLADGSTFIHTTTPVPLVGNLKTKSNKWEGGGLKFEILQPLKRFRVTFNGLLMKRDGSIHHVRTNFIWSGVGKLIDLRNDWSPWLMASALSRDPWKQHEWRHLIKDQGLGFDQWGAMRGEVYIDSEAPFHLNLPSLRQRRYGPAEAQTLTRRLGLTGFTKDGTLFYIRATSSPLGLSYAKFGHVLYPNRKIHTITHCNIGLQNLSDNTRSRLPNNMLVTFTANRTRFSAFATLGKGEHRVHGQNFVARLTNIMLSLNNDVGFGVAEFWYRADNVHVNKPSKPDVDLFHCDEKPKSDQYVVQFSDSICRNPDVTGGKGSSLAVLTSLKDSQFEVPVGFCITTNAFNKHLMENKYISRAVALLPHLAEQDLKDGCENVMQLFKSTPMSKSISEKILQEYKNFEGEAAVAVRSSAIGEDSEETSAAGQNATFLGVTGEENLLKAVQECWASAYSYHSVQYRMQHGQIVLCKMAVVVQKMVQAEKAGVVFTRNPVTGDPRNILISANYGLGESVVSGEVDPDTIEVFRSLNDELKISSIQIGGKKHKITMSENGTEQEELTPDDSNKACLSDVEMLNLGKIAISIDKTFDSARDIEWAIKDGQIYLLQVRPVTSINQWTEYELLHEMDTPVCSDTELCTVANSGEVFPGASTVLTQSIIINNLASGGEKDTVRISHHRALIDLLATALRYPSKELGFDNTIGDIAIIGHPLVNEELLNIAQRRNGIHGNGRKFQEFVYCVYLALKAKRVVKDSTELAKNFQINADLVESAADLHRALTIQLSVMKKACDYHLHTSRNSVFLEAMCLSLLCQGSRDISEENLLDVAGFLSNTDAISGDIPTSLKKIATTISEGENPESFLEINPENGFIWLKENNSTAYLMFRRFIQKHGHRGMREFDFSSDVWGTNPSQVVKMIQAVVKNRDKSKSVENSEVKSNLTAVEIINQLKSPLKPELKSVLKFLIPICQNGVAYREITKSNLISVVHQFRLAYRKLGQLLVFEGLLPRADLVFHLTHYEISHLIKTRSPTLVIKAMRRQRSFPEWNQIILPELMIGPAEAIEREIVKTEGEIKVKGFPVYPGNALGRAIVINDVNEIDQIRKGDILITHCTDVGWSPCFPLLGGIVTELGGLISHGAVVAREYGLPCLVGVVNATAIFKTGDTVLLSGSIGTIEKVSGGNP